MNNFKKIGLSALAGSLVAVSAQAADVSLSGGASVAFTKANDSGKTGYYMNDSITATVSGETDSGLTITTSLELDGASAASTGSFDNRSITISTEDMGTITFAGHGGDSVIGGWDDVMPTAYEEVFALTTSTAASNNGNTVIAGFGGNNLWRYDSPTISGASIHMAYQSTGGTAAAGGTPARSSTYSDMGIQIAPEMVEGLSVGYAVGEYDETASKSIDISTLWVKYAYGSFTVGVQESTREGSAATDHDSSESWAVSYAVSDDISVSYGQHEYEEGTTTDVQESSGFSASYTSGGVSISAAFNSTDNIQATAADDEDSYEIAFSFAF